MSLTIIPREAWGAKPPQKITRVPMSKRTGVVNHYSGALKTQTVKSIQHYCMVVKGHSDIDYNFLVDFEGRAYEGRGWDNVGSHCLNYNTATIGICFIGLDGDVTDAAKRTMRALYDEANRRAGKTLKLYCHQDLRPTSCPGSNLCRWTKAGMPLPGGLGGGASNWTEALVTTLPTVKLGSTDAVRVKIVQGILNARGFPVIVDGEFGARTHAATRGLQRRFGAESVDGVWGPETWTIGLTGSDSW